MTLVWALDLKILDLLEASTRSTYKMASTDSVTIFAEGTFTEQVRLWPIVSLNTIGLHIVEP